VRRLLAVICVYVCGLCSGCACDHAVDAAILERGTELLYRACGTAQSRPLTEAEQTELEQGRAALLRYSALLKEELDQ
jgi:hypothetical protein